MNINGIKPHIEPEVFNLLMEMGFSIDEIAVFASDQKILNDIKLIYDIR